jgi:hypothetical protein
MRMGPFAVGPLELRKNPVFMRGARQRPSGRACHGRPCGQLTTDLCFFKTGRFANQSSTSNFIRGANRPFYLTQIAKMVLDTPAARRLQSELLSKLGDFRPSPRPAPPFPAAGAAPNSVPCIPGGNSWSLWVTSRADLLAAHPFAAGNAPTAIPKQIGKSRLTRFCRR